MVDYISSSNGSMISRQLRDGDFISRDLFLGGLSGGMDKNIIRLGIINSTDNISIRHRQRNKQQISIWLFRLATGNFKKYGDSISRAGYGFFNGWVDWISRGGDSIHLGDLFLNL